VLTPPKLSAMSDPKCDTCGAEITTGLMAVFCPRGDCEFMPPEGLPPEFQAWREQVRKERKQSKSTEQR
jgi:hypothetical protein